MSAVSSQGRPTVEKLNHTISTPGFPSQCKNKYFFLGSGAGRCSGLQYSEHDEYSSYE